MSLSSDLEYKALLAGEAKGAFLLASIQCQLLLRNAKVKHASDLPFHLVTIYDALNAKAETLRAEARKR